MQKQAILRGFAMLTGLLALFKALTLAPPIFELIMSGALLSLDRLTYWAPWQMLVSSIFFGIYVFIAFRLLVRPPRSLVANAGEGARGFVEAVTRQISLLGFLLASGSLSVLAYMILHRHPYLLATCFLAVPLLTFMVFTSCLVLGRPKRLTEAVCDGSQDGPLSDKSALRLVFLFGGMLFLSQLVGSLSRYSGTFDSSRHLLIRAEMAYGLICTLLAMAASIYLICGAPLFVRWLLPSDQEEGPDQTQREPEGLI